VSIFENDKGYEELIKRRARHGAWLAKVLIFFYWAFGAFLTLEPPIVLIVGVPGYLHEHFVWTRRLKSYPGCVPSCEEPNTRRFESESAHFEAYVEDAQQSRFLYLFFVVIFFGLTAGRLSLGRWKLELILAGMFAFCIVTCQQWVFLSISDYLTLLQHQPPALFLSNGTHPTPRDIIVYGFQRSLNGLSFGFLENYGFKMSDVSTRSGSGILATGITVFDYLVPISVYGVYGFMQVSRRLSARIMDHLHELAR